MGYTHIEEGKEEKKYELIFNNNYFKFFNTIIV